jgi:hypothetical protein
MGRGQSPALRFATRRQALSERAGRDRRNRPEEMPPAAARLAPVWRIGFGLLRRAGEPVVHAKSHRDYCGAEGVPTAR